MPVLHTPQRTLRQDPSEVLFSAEKTTGPRDGEMEKLLAIRNSLEGKPLKEAEPAVETEEELRARNLRLMKEAANHLQRQSVSSSTRLSKGFGQPAFEALHRLVCFAKDAAEAKDRAFAEEMVAAGADGIFRCRLQRGRKEEHIQCLSGFASLQAFPHLCPRVENLMKGLEDLKTLADAEKAPADCLKAMTELCSYIREECKLKMEAAEDAKPAEREELPILLAFDLIPVLQRAGGSLPKRNSAHLALLRCIHELDEAYGATVRKGGEQPWPLGDLVKDIFELLKEATYIGKNIQPRKALRGALTEGALRTIRARWSHLPEELSPILTRLWGAESLIYILKVVADNEIFLHHSVAKALSDLWRLVTDRKWSNVAFVEPELEDEMATRDKFLALRASFAKGCAQRSRKRKAAAMEDSSS